MKHITSDKPLFAIDPRSSDSVRSDIARGVHDFGEDSAPRLSGCMTPLVLWPHHFDLAFIWFATERTE